MNVPLGTPAQRLESPTQLTSGRKGTPAQLALATHEPSVAGWKEEPVSEIEMFLPAATVSGEIDSRIGSIVSVYWKASPTL